MNKMSWLFCVVPGCTEEIELENTEDLSPEELVQAFVKEGWGVRPALCPTHKQLICGLTQLTKLERDQAIQLKAKDYMLCTWKRC